MAGSYRKPIDKNAPIPFTIEEGEQIHSGTITPTGKPPAFGMPNAFLVRITGKPIMNMSIYMGKWVMSSAPDSLTNALGKWIEEHYK